MSDDSAAPGAPPPDAVDEARERMKALARPFVARGEATGWFEPLYAAAAGDPSGVPWADMEPTPGVVEWCARHGVQGEGRRALVVGCGLGDDAGLLADLGFAVTGFDIAPSAIDWCRRRYAGRPIHFEPADLFAPPRGWLSAFDFVVEVNTIQALPPALRADAVPRLGYFLAPGGRLLLVARGREAADPPGELPWPLARPELAPLLASGLVEESFEDYLDDEDPPVRRFRAVYRRPVE